MPRTYFLRSYVSKIDQLNDQLWYYLFINEELNNRLSQFSSAVKENYLEDLFASNSFRGRLHIRTNDIPGHQIENKNLTFGAYFATCYEIGSKYIEFAFSILKQVNSITTYAWDKRKEPEKNLISLLAAGGLLTPNVNFTDTFTYLRLRRNHYTHIIETINPKLAGFIATISPRLNTFWSAAPRSINFDFTRTLVRNFNQAEILHLIRMLRICILEIDLHLIGVLDRNGLIEFIVKREYESRATRMNNYVLQQRQTRIRKIFFEQMGLNINNALIAPHASTIGIR